MPKISAATVAEHRAQVQERLIDAAERILQAGGDIRLTAGAVTQAAGIARNSIYRYVDSVDGLRALVVARHLPDWMSAVTRAMGEATSPIDRVVAWVQANLTEASANGHAWLMDAVRAAPREERAASADAAHSDLRGSLLAAWSDVFGGDAPRASLAASLTFGVVETGFRRLEAGDATPLVRELCEGAVRGMANGAKS